MNAPASRYRGYRFHPEIISPAVWLYYRFSLSFRDVEDLLAQRGIIVSYETIRRWCEKFGPGYAAKLKRREGRLGDIWHLDEVFVAEVSHQPTRRRERQMQRFKSGAHAQRFLVVHGIVGNLFRVGRNLVRAVHHRLFRERAFEVWNAVTSA